MGEAKDWAKCNWCGDEESPLQNYYGDALCADCIKMDRETDWEAWEQKKRERIAEQNEY